MSGDAPYAALDLRRLLAVLMEHGVEFVIVGGVAVQVHGHRRTTKDLDVVPGPAAENIERLAKALRALNARPAGIPGGSPTAEQLATAPIVPPLITDHGEIHVLNDVPGAPPFAQLAARALRVPLGEIVLSIAGLDDLISMKRAAGRERDLADLEVLAAPEQGEQADP